MPGRFRNLFSRHVAQEGTVRRVNDPAAEAMSRQSPSRSDPHDASSRLPNNQPSGLPNGQPSPSTSGSFDDAASGSEPIEELPRHDRVGSIPTNTAQPLPVVTLVPPDIENVLESHQPPQRPKFPELGPYMHTRLITLESRAGNDDILRCSSTPVALRDELSYDALSYHWGSERATAEMILNGNPHMIPLPLHQALLALRGRGITTLWVDTLSINQDEVMDKDRQISKMHVIYSHAARVFAWLGPRYLPNSTRDGQLGVTFLSQALPTDRAPNVDEILAVQDVVERPYWRRCWIIQELCKAKEAVILCGSAEASFAQFWDNQEQFNRDYGWTSDVAQEHLSSLKAFHMQESAVTRKPQMSLIMALLRSRFSEASLKRDKIFAMLNLAHDSDKLVDTPNYRQHDNTIFWKLAHGMVHLQGHVAIILLARRASQQGEGATRQSSHRRPTLQTRHYRSRSLSSQDIRGFNSQAMTETEASTLPSWVPKWSELDDPLPPWILQSVIYESAETPRTKHDGQVLSIRGLKLETIVSTSGIPGFPRYSTPVPNATLSTTHSATTAESSLGFRLTRTFTMPVELRLSTAFGVVRKLWSAILAPHYSEPGQRIPPIGHQCGSDDCYAQRVQGHAIARLLMDETAPTQMSGNRRDIFEWMSINKKFHINGRMLQDWLRDLLQPQPSTDQQMRRGSQGLVTSTCDFPNEAEYLGHAFRTLKKYKLRLAVISNKTFQVVYCEALPGDEICWLDGCSLPVVLRATREPLPELVELEVPDPSTPDATTRPEESSGPTRWQGFDSDPYESSPYQYVGEVYLHEFLHQGHLETSKTGWEDEAFSDEKKVELRIT